MNVKKLWNYFNKTEKILWCSSVLLITVSFCLFDRTQYLTLAASIIGATSLIFHAKGNPIGQVLMIMFSILYGIISLQCAYYGEMITYLGMTMPMAIIALVSWLRHPFHGNKAEVQVNSLTKKDLVIILILTAAITVAFYFILAAFHTQNLIPSTISVATSFFAVALTFRRSPYYALAYAANDIVLIVLWILAARTDSSYLSVIICFVMFLVNDLYGFVNWKRMHRRQSASI